MGGGILQLTVTDRHTHGWFHLLWNNTNELTIFQASATYHGGPSVSNEGRSGAQDALFLDAGRVHSQWHQVESKEQSQEQAQDSSPSHCIVGVMSAEQGLDDCTQGGDKYVEPPSFFRNCNTTFSYNATPRTSKRFTTSFVIQK